MRQAFNRLGCGGAQRVLGDSQPWLFKSHDGRDKDVTLRHGEEIRYCARPIVVAQHAMPHASTMNDTCPNGPSRINLQRKMLMTPSGYHDISPFRVGLASSRSRRLSHSGCFGPRFLLSAPVAGGQLFPFVLSAGMEYSPALLYNRCTITHS